MGRILGFIYIHFIMETLTKTFKNQASYLSLIFASFFISETDDSANSHIRESFKTLGGLFKNALQYDTARVKKTLNFCSPFSGKKHFFSIQIHNQIRHGSQLQYFIHFSVQNLSKVDQKEPQNA